MRKITLYSQRPPEDEEVQAIVDWLCNSLGLVSGRDKERTAATIFKRIVEASERGERLTTTQLAEELDVTRGTINHHLRNFIEAGLLTREKRTIRLRRHSLSRTIEELRRDADRIFDELKRFAEEVDEELYD